MYNLQKQTGGGGVEYAGLEMNKDELTVTPEENIEGEATIKVPVIRTNECNQQT